MDITRNALFGHRGLIGWMLLICSSCGGDRTPSEHAIPVAREVGQSIGDPLTADDVRMFLQLVDRLPEGRVPEFEPLAQSNVSRRLAAASLAEAWRREYRAMFDAVGQGKRWRKDGRLTEVLEAEQIEPEQLAALVTRLSCAISADAVGSKLDLQEVVDRSEHQLQSIVQQLDTLDAQLRSGAVTDPHGAVHQRKQLVEMLKHTVALSEFSRILQSVPPASVAVVRQFREQLGPHLPKVADEGMFERWSETNAVVLPAGFEGVRSQE